MRVYESCKTATGLHYHVRITRRSLNSGFHGIPDSTLWIANSTPWIPDSTLHSLDSGFHSSLPGFQIPLFTPWIPDSTLHSLDSGFHSSLPGFRIPLFTPWIPDSTLHSLDSGFHSSLPGFRIPLFTPWILDYKANKRPDSGLHHMGRKVGNGNVIRSKGCMVTVMLYTLFDTMHVFSPGAPAFLRHNRYA